MRPRVASTVSTVQDNLECPLSTSVLGDAQLLLQAGVSESLAGVAAHGDDEVDQEPSTGLQEGCSALGRAQGQCGPTVPKGITCPGLKRGGLRGT